MKRKLGAAKECAFPRLTAISFILFVVVAKAHTPADTIIQSQATINFILLNQAQTLQSNIAAFTVDELVDLVLVSQNPSPVTTMSPESNRVLTFALTNLGNALEKYSLTATQLSTSTFNMSNLRIYLDTPGTGIFDSTKDTLYVFGTNDPVIAAGSSLIVFVVSDAPSGINENSLASVSLRAASTIGTGAPGTTFSSAGVGGSSAVLGASGGISTATGSYKVSLVSVTLTKSQAVLNQQGGSQPNSGAIVTYTLALNLAGTSSVNGLSIQDPIPTGTTYVSGSLKLDGTAIADTGHFNGSGIQVELGTLSAPANHQVSFQVQIQ